MSKIFSNSVWERKIICETDIQFTDGGKGKKKAELFDLCQEAVAMKHVKLATFAEDRKKVSVEGEFIKK